MKSPTIEAILRADPDFEAILKNPKYSAEAIGRFLARKGMPGRPTIIKEYRRALRHNQEGNSDSTLAI